MEDRNRTGPPDLLESSNRKPVPAAALEKSAEPQVDRTVRTLGSRVGLVTLTFLDLIALDDITTAGAWMPEIGFIAASVPALVVLAYYSVWPYLRSTGRLGGPPVSEGR